MRLAELLDALPGSQLMSGSLDLEVNSVEVDSRAVAADAMFCCISGTSDDGHKYASAAIGRGAVALLTEREITDGPFMDVAEIRVPMGTARSATAMASALVVHRPADRLTMIGVTGTNGKTTVVHLVSEILRSIGFSVRSIGTLTGERTTPAAPDLQRLLAQIEGTAVGEGRPGAVAMEVSSHALDQHRVDQVSFDVAIFTNLSHDHLDYHGTMDAYFEAKARLFDDAVSSSAVIWAETEDGRQLLARREGPTVAVTFDDAVDLELGPRGSDFVWRGHRVSLRILGRNGVIDALLAAEAAIALGGDPAEIALALSRSPGVPGRMELVMGSVAMTGADAVVVTTDNPRHEDPQVIIDAIVDGMHGAPVTIELDRAAAIAHAIESSGPEDLVLIAGKGHEVTQQIGTIVRDFDDRTVAGAILRSLSQGR